MNEVIQAMLTRRSVRGYKPDPVPRALLEEVARAGTYAATGHGCQSPLIVVITDKALRDRLSELNRQIGGWKEGFDPFYGAPAALLVLADRKEPTHVYDGSLVMGNLMLAAHALGLGSCWINRARQVFERPEWQELLRSLGVEGEYEGIANCILGYPDGPAPEADPRKENYVYYI